MPGGSFSTIGRYQVESELGQGGFGRVYKAFDPTVGRPVAIKVLTAIDSPDMLARFQTEAKATGNLHHPNIVTVYDSGVHEGSPYIAMEYLEGEDLQHLTAFGQPLSLLDKVRIMTQAGQGLQCAHQNGVIHRDVKPSNIRVLPGGNVKVMDFGIARMAHDDSATRRTGSGILVGTIRYMAPEQFQGEDADALCDIFAYGLVFYELLAGQYPFPGSDPARIMFQVMSEQPASLSQAAPGCPEALDKIVTRALEKDRSLRYQSFDDLLPDLQVVLLGLQQQRAAELLCEARALKDSGQPTEARALVRNAMELDPYNAEGRQFRVEIEQLLHQMSVQARVDEALRAAAALAERGSFEEAIKRLESSRINFPDSPEIAESLEKVRLARDQPERQQAPADPPRPVDPPRPPAPAELQEDRTVLVSAPATGMFAAPPPEAAHAPPPPEFTSFFGKPEPDAPLTGFLTIVACPDSFREGQTVAIRTFPFSIGRAQGDLLISEDPTLSRQHASISWNGSGFSIRDLGSPNGTYLNGRRLPPNQDQTLPLNAEIRLSNTTRLRFRCDISELPDFTGQKLAGRYMLEKCLRAGRKSAFYAASDSRPVRHVAVKLLSPTLATYPGYLEQFEREAQTAAELNHPNICKIYEYGCEPLAFGPGAMKPVHYLCMQMLDGGSLASRLDAPEHTTPASVSAWLDIVAAALEDAHRSGVIHAGLKPTSVVFSAGGVPYVTDFAIANRPQNAERRLPVLGAPEYLAPEQWDGLPAGPESDQYSLACLCYRVLTGAVPFENQMEPQNRSRNFEQGPVPADVRARRQGRPPLPPALSGVLAKALAVRPADRFPAITDFALAFRNGLGEVAVKSRKPRVFVSYRREADAGWAALFADKLDKQHGLDVYVDRQRVDSARHVPEKIETAIRGCDFFICLLNRSTLASAWVREEIRIADAAGKPMIPVVHEGFRRPVAWPVPAWLRRILPAAWQFPECARRLMDAEEVRLFADYDEGAIEKLARMILATLRKPDPGRRTENSPDP